MRNLTDSERSFIMDNRLTIPISEIAKTLSRSTAVVRKQYNLRELPYLNDRGKIREFKTKGKRPIEKVEVRGLTKGEKKHINQQIKPPERFF